MRSVHAAGETHSMIQGSLLLVDDDRQVLESMADWLRSHGLQVDAAAASPKPPTGSAARRTTCCWSTSACKTATASTCSSRSAATHPESQVILHHRLRHRRHGRRSHPRRRLRLPHQAADRRRTDDVDRAGLRPAAGDRRKQEAQAASSTCGSAWRTSSATITAMRRMFDMIDSVADTKATVLITGESGTGKSLIARAIHRRSRRSDKPFVEVACGALPENLLESELFGHVAGVVHRRDRRQDRQVHAGRRRHDLPRRNRHRQPGMQVKLLRVLQELAVRASRRRQDASRSTSRVILATNEDLAEAGRRGPVPPGPVLPRQRHQHRAAAAARPHRATSRCWPSTSSNELREDTATQGHRLHRRSVRRAASATAGRAMFASCRTSSSGPCCSARAS